MEVAKSALLGRGLTASFPGIFGPMNATFVALDEGRVRMVPTQGAGVVQPLWIGVEGVEKAVRNRVPMHPAS